MKKILVFDDDDGIRDVIKIILLKKGYVVRTFMNLDNVFEKIGEFKPDLILIDLLMPKVKGEDIVKQIKTDYRYKFIPIVILSASKDTENIAKESGADDYLYKPFDLSDLETIVEKYTYALR